MHVSKFADTAYLFLLINEDDREKRKDYLMSLCIPACHKITCPELIGVVSGGAQKKFSSIDAFVIDVRKMQAETKPEKEFKMFDKPVYEEKNEWDFE